MIWIGVKSSKRLRSSEGKSSVCDSIETVFNGFLGFWNKCSWPFSLPPSLRITFIEEYTRPVSFNFLVWKNYRPCHSLYLYPVPCKFIQFSTNVHIRTWIFFSVSLSTLFNRTLLQLLFFSHSRRYVRWMTLTRISIGNVWRSNVDVDKGRRRW